MPLKKFRSLLSVLLLAALSLHAQEQEQERQRLILKNGSYQVVTRYQVKGDRVRYQSAERGNEWEEIPYKLIDWPATQQWAKAHTAGAAQEPSSPGESEAAEIDREAAAERADEAGRQPKVAPGLRLPDESGVWALDTFRGRPELSHIDQSTGNLNRDTGHTLQPAAIPAGGAKEMIRIDGMRAAVQFHVAQPVLYVAIDPPPGAPPRPAPEGAMVVDTHTGNDPALIKDRKEYSAPDSHYVIMPVHVGKGLRTIAAMQMSQLGHLSADIIETKTEVLPGAHWLKVTPKQPLNFGEYVLVEQLAPTVVNLNPWDFGVDPRAPENKNSFAPLIPSAPDADTPGEPPQ